MRMNKTHLIVFIVGAILGLLCGFFSGKAIYDHPLYESVSRDTVTLWDTIPHWYPVPVEAKPQKPQYKWLTRVEPVSRTDTLIQHDSVLVEVPIESRHYHEAEFDAWVSGYEPSLDSIKVYQKTEYITERVVVSKPPNKWELGAMAGIDYNTAAQRYTPFAGGELLYKPSRLQLGIHGGVIKIDKFEPFIGATIRYKVF